MEIVEDAVAGSTNISSVFPHADSEKVTVGDNTESGGGEVTGPETGGGGEDDVEP